MDRRWSRDFGDSMDMRIWMWRCVICFVFPLKLCSVDRLRVYVVYPYSVVLCLYACTDEI